MEKDRTRDGENGKRRKGEKGEGQLKEKRLTEDANNTAVNKPPSIEECA